MKRRMTAQTEKQEAGKPRRKRADGLRKMDSLLQAAMEVFAKSGVDAPVREIAERAGVGLGTVYRHFPQRSDLIVAVFKSQMDACADAASVIASKYEPGEALARWMQRYVDFIATKRGLAPALHRPAYRSSFLGKRLRPSYLRLPGCGRSSEGRASSYGSRRPATSSRNPLPRSSRRRARLCAKDGRTTGGWPALRSRQANQHAGKSTRLTCKVETHRAPRSRTQTHGQCCGRTTKIA